MMTALLLYGYSRGVRSSRKIETACEERVDFMAVTGRQAPDHRTISDFRGQPSDRDGAQRNFTDPESRIMKGPDGFVQAYNCQVAVDAASHVIVAAHVSSTGHNLLKLAAARA